MLTSKWDEQHLALYIAYLLFLYTLIYHAVWCGADNSGEYIHESHFASYSQEIMLLFVMFQVWSCWNHVAVCNVSGLELLKEAIEKAGYTGKIEIGMDVAASEFCKESKYDLDFKNPDSDKSLWVSSDR